MIWNVLLLGAASGIDPARIAHIAFMLTRSRPLRLLVVYWVGAFGVSMMAGIVLLTVLKDFGFGQGSSVPPDVEIAVGVVLLVIAAVVGTGLAARLAKRRQPHRSADAPTDKVPRTPKLPAFAQRALASESPWIAWIAGVGVGMPNAYFLAALALILGSGAPLPAQVGAVFAFNLVSFAVVEIPIVSYAIAPEETRARVEQLHPWIDAHRRPVTATITGVLGAYLVIVGVSKLG